MAQRASFGPLIAANRPALSRAWLLRSSAMLPVALGSLGAGAQTVAPNAAPTGGQVVAGQAGIAQSATRTTITQTTDRAAINWQTFNVGSNQTVQFQQPGAGSWTLNRVMTPDPSVIAGRIQANGGVAIVNQSGIFFSRSAQVDVGSLIASAPGITNENFMAGRMRFDQAARPGAQVRNEGRITVMDRGIAVLAGPRVSNTGEIRARLGRVALAGAEAYALDLAGDGLISIDVTQAVRGGGAGIVTNEGLIEANGGSVLLTATAAGDLVEGLVRNTGTIRANTEAGQAGQVALRAQGGGVEAGGTITATGGTGQQGGRIALQSNQSVRVTGTAVVDASGGAAGGTVLVGTTGIGRNQTMARSTTVERGARISADATVLGQGGTIAINSTETTLVEGTLSVRGGPQGGNGGFVEISGLRDLNISAVVDRTAPLGSAGTLLIDPDAINITNNSAPAGGVNASGDQTIQAISAAGVLSIRASELSASTGNIILEATTSITSDAAVAKGAGNVTLTAATVTLGAAFGVTGGGASLTINATGNVALNGAISSPTVTINAGGTVTQTGTLTTGALTVVGAGGVGNAASITLGTATNAITGITSLASAAGVTVDAGTGAVVSVGNVSAANAVALTANGTATLTGTITGSTVSITAGAISQTGGSITAGAGTGAITFNASGAIVQSVGTSLAGGALTVRGTSGGATNAASFTFETGTNTLGSIDARTTGTLLLQAGGNGGTLGVAGAVSSTSGLVSITGNAGTSLNVTGAVSGTAAVTLVGNSIALGANVTGGTGAVVALQLRNGGLLNGAGVVGGAGASTARVGAVGGGSNFRTGATAAGGTVTVDAVTLNAMTSNTLVLGVNEGGGTTAAAVTIADALTRTGSRAIDIRSGDAMSIDASLTSGTGGVTLNAGTTLTQTTGTISALGATASLTGAGAVSLQGAVSAGTITVTSTNSNLDLAGGPINAGAGTVSLRAAGAIGQSNATAAITAATLNATDAAGTGRAVSIDLATNGTSNAISAIGALRSVGTASLSSSVALSVGTVDAGGAFNLRTTGGSVTITGAVGGASGTITSASNITQSGTSTITVTGNLALNADGAISQSGTSSISAGSVTVRGTTGGATSAASLNLGQTGNTLGSLDALTTGALTAVSGGASFAAAQAISSTSGTVTLTGNAATTTLAVSGTVQGTAALALSGLGITSTGTVSAGSSVTMTAGTGGISQTAGTITASGGTGAINLNSDGAITQSGGAATLSGGTVTVRGTAGGSTRAGSLDLNGGGLNQFGTLHALTTGALGARSSGSALTFTVAQADSNTTGSIALSGSGGAAMAVTGLVSGTAGVDLSGTGVTIGASVSGNAISILSTADITQTLGTITGTGSNPTLALRGNGAISQSGGSIAMGATGTVTVRGVAGGGTSAGSLDLNQSANVLGTLDALTTGAITARSGGTTFGVAQAVSSTSGAVLLTGGVGTGITTSGTVSGTSTVGLTASSMSIGGALSGQAITLIANSAGTIQFTSGAVTASGGAATLTLQGGVITQNGGTIAAGLVTVRGSDGSAGSLATSLSLDQPGNVIGTLDARSNGTLTVRSDALTVQQATGNSAVTLTATSAAGTGITVAAGGLGVSTTGTVLLSSARSVAIGRLVSTAGAVNIEIGDGGLLQGTGAVVAPGGIRVGAASALGGLGMLVNGTAASGTIALERGTLEAMNASSVVLGVNRSGTTTATTVDVGAVTMTNGVALDIRGSGLIQTGGDVTATGVSFTAGTFTQNTGTIAGGTGATQITASGLVTLGGTGVTGNSITVNSTTGGITLSSAVIVNANAGAGTVNLQAAGAIAQTGTSIIRAGSLTVTGANGSGSAASADLLNGFASNNAITTLTLARVAGALNFWSTSAATSITDVSVGANSSLLAQGSLSVTGTVTSTGGTNLLISALGAVTLSGTISSGPGQLTLGTDTSIIQTGGSITTGALGVALASNLANPALGTVSLTRNTNAITGTSASDGVRTSGALAIVTSGAIGLNGAIAGATVSITAPTSITQTAGSVNGLTVALRSDGAISQSAGTTLSTVGGLTVGGVAGGTARAGAVTLGNSGNVISAITDARSSGAMTIHGGNVNLSVNNADATGLLTLTSTNTASPSGTLVGNGVTITATNGIFQNGGSIGGGAGTVTLRSDAAVQQNIGTISGAGLTVGGASVASAGSVTVLQPGNSFTSILTVRATGDINIRSDATTLTIFDASTSTGNMTFRGGAVGGTTMNLNGTISVLNTRTINLRTDGAANQGTAPTAQIIAGTLDLAGQSVPAMGSASLGQANDVPLLVANVAGALVYRTTSDFSTATPGQAVTVGSLDLTAPNITVAPATTLSVSSGDIALVASQAGTGLVQIDGTVTGVAGQRVVLRADSIRVSGTITSNGLAALEVGALTAANNTTIGNTATDQLPVATVNRLMASGATRVQFGETTIGTSTVRNATLLVTSSFLTAATTTALVLASNAAIAVNGDVTVSASGGTTAVTMRAAGTVAGNGAVRGAASLTIRGADGTGGSNNVTLQAGGNNVASYDVITTGSVRIVNTGGDTTINRIQSNFGAVFDGNGRTVTVAVNGITAGSGNIDLRGTTVNVNAPVTGSLPSGQTVNIQADTIFGAGLITANGGTVNFGPTTAGAYSVFANLSVTLPTNAVVGAAGTVRIGQSSFNGAAAVTASSLAADFAITRTLPGTLAFIGGTVDVTANVTAPSLRVTSTTGAITLNAQTLTASTAVSGQMTLDAATGISQTGGALIAPNFSAIARNGDIDLQAANQITNIAGGVTGILTPGRGFANATRGLSATGSIALVTTTALTISNISGATEAGTTLSISAASLNANAASFSGGATTLIATAAGGISVSGTLRADAITLRSAGAVTKGGSGGFAGAADATTTALTILNAAGTANSSAGGAVSITGGGNAIATLDAGATGALNVISANAMTVNRAVATTTVTLNGPSLTLAGAVTAGAASTVSLTTTSGGITQTAGVITGATLTVAAPGQVSLVSGDAARTNPTGWNQVTALGAVTVTGGSNGFTFYNSRAAGLSIGAAVSAPGPVLIVSNGTLSLPAAGSVNTSAGNGSVALASNGAMTLAGTINSGTGQTTLTSLTGSISQTAGSITAGAFGASGVGVSLGTGNTFSGALALASGTGDVVIDQAGTVTLGSVVAPTVTGSVTISGFSGTNVTITADALTGGGNPILSATGNIILRVDALSLTGAMTAASIAVGPKTAGSAVQIGSADTGTTLGFSGTTLDVLASAGAPLTIGQTVIGASTVTGGAITLGTALNATNNVTLIGGGDGTVNAAANLGPAGSFVLVSGGNISLPGSITARMIRLSASGSVIQPDNLSSVGGTYAGTTFLNTTSVFGLAVRAGSGDIDLRAPGNTVTGLAAASVTGSVNVVGGAAMSVNLISGSFLLPGGTTTSVAGVTAAQDVFLQTDSLFNANGIAAGNGRTVTLRADAMDLAGAVTATGGTVNLETLSLTRPITLGAEVTNTLSLTQAELNQVTAGRLVIGRTDGATGSAISVAANVSLPGTVGALRLIGGSLALGGNLDATGKTIEAFIAGATTRTTGFISASLLDYRGIGGAVGSDAGAVTLDGANRIGTLSLRSSGAVNIGLDANGGTTTISLLRGTSVTATGQGTNGTISVNGGLVESTSGAFSLTGASTLNTLSAITGANGLTLSGGAVTIGAQATATAGLASLTSTSGALTLNAGVTALNGGASFAGATATQVNAAISTTGGGATFSGVGLTSVVAGTITVSGGNLSATNTGTVSIGGVVQASTGSASFTGGTTFNNGATITGQTGVTISAGTTTIGALVTATTGTASLTSTSAALTLNAGVTTLAGGASFSGATATQLNAAVSVTGGGATFSGVGLTSAPAGTITVSGGNLSATNSGTVTIGGVVQASTGSASFTGATTFDNSAAITGQTGLTISSGTTTIGAAVQATTSTLALTSTTGALTLNATATTLAGGATFASNGAATLVNAAVSVTGGAAGFTGTGFTSVVGGTITVGGGNTTIANTGTVTIGGTVSNTTGSVSITGGTTLDTTASITGTTGLTLSAGSLTIGAALGVTGTGSAGLTANTGSIALNAGGLTVANGGATFASTTSTTVNAAVSVTGGALGFTGVGFSSNASGTLTVSGGNITIANTGTVTIGGTVSNTTGSVSVTGGTTLGTTASITGETGVTLSAGGVTLGGAVTANTGNASVTGTAGGVTANATVTATTGNLTIDATGGVVLNGAISSVADGTVTLNAGAPAGAAADSITQTAAGIIGGVSGGTTNLVVNGRSPGAPVTLTQANRLTTLDGRSLGALSVTGTGALTVTRATSPTAVTLNALSLSLTGPVSGSATGTVSLTATGGTITQTAPGIITALTLSGGATGDITLTAANNQVSRTGAFTLGANFTLRSVIDLTVTSALSTPGNAVTLTGASLALQGPVTAGTVSLTTTTTGITQTAAGIITTPSLTISAATSAILDAGDAAATATTNWNQVDSLIASSALGGNFTLRNSRDLSIDGAISASGTNTLRLDVTGTTTLSATGSLATSGGATRIAGSGTVTLLGTINNGAGLASITSATGAVLQTGGTITGGLAVQGNGNIDFQQAGNAITTLAANAIGGRVDVLSATAITVNTATLVPLHGGTTTTITGVTGSTVFLTAPGISATSPITATTGDVQLRADAMALASTIGAAAGQVRLEQLTLGVTPRPISLGFENAGALSLTTSELAGITTPTLIIGRSTGTGATAVAGQITVAGAVNVPGTVSATLRLQGSGIAVNGALGATGTATTELRALTGSITTAGGSVTGQALSATAPFGSVTLDGANDFATLSGSTIATGSFTYRDINGVQIVAPGITAQAVTLSTDTNNLTQTATGLITASTLSARANAGSVLLDGAGTALNQVGSITGGGAAGSGVFQLRNATGFTIAGTLDNGAGGALGTLRLFTPNGSIAQTAGTIRANRLEVTLPGGGASFGQANDIATLGTSTIAGDFTLTNAGSLALAGPVDVGSTAGGPFSITTLTLNNGNLTQGTGARLRTDMLVASALSGDVLLTAVGSTSPNDLSQVGVLAGVTAGGNVDLRLGAPTRVAGLLRAGSAAGTPTGALSLEAPGITIGVPIQVGTLIRAGTVVLRTQSGFDGPAGAPTGSITQQGGAVEANALSVSPPPATS